MVQTELSASACESNESTVKKAGAGAGCARSAAVRIRRNKSLSDRRLKLQPIAARIALGAGTAWWGW